MKREYLLAYVLPPLHNSTRRSIQILDFEIVDKATVERAERVILSAIGFNSSVESGAWIVSFQLLRTIMTDEELMSDAMQAPAFAQKDGDA
jgi:hypothetical protein